MMDPGASYDSGESSTTYEFTTPSSEKFLSWNAYGDSRYQRPPTIESRRDSARWSDKRVHELGLAAASKVNWDDLDLELATASAASVGSQQGSSCVWKPKKFRQSGSTEMQIFTRSTVRDRRHQTRWGPKGFAILAEASLPCTVQELRLVFRVASSDTFRDIMRCLYRREFIDGDLLRTINLQRGSSGDPARAFGDRELTIKTATFESRHRVFSKKASWCFLELLHPRDRAKEEQSSARRTAVSTPRLGTPPRPGFTRTMVSVARPSLVLDNGRPLPSRSQLLLHVPNVIINYSFEEDPSGHGTRVVFHGEYVPPNAHDAFKRAGHERRYARRWMLRLAVSCQRYLLVVRRRRLGMQVMVNSTCFSAETLAASASYCAYCYRSFSSFLKRSRKRLCCLCGFVVCDKCAHVQEREHCARGDVRPQIEQVRVCERCLLRVDQARYTAITEDDLRPARVIPDVYSPASRPNSTPGGRAWTGTSRHIRPNFRTRPASLNGLLLEILADATAGGPAQQQRKESVLRVMKDIVNEDRAQRRASLARSRSLSLGASARGLPLQSERSGDLQSEEENGDDDSCVGSARRRLGRRWGAAPCYEDDYPLANADSRSYRIQFPDNAEEAIVPPVPINERQRLQLIRGQQLDDLGNVPELDIICSLASKELDCAMSMVTVVDKAKLHVLASSDPTITAGESFPRAQALCAQAILDRNPLVACHVQADVRFSAMSIVRKMGINFYCGFPLLGSDGETVIGSVCCADPQGRSLTRSQYSAMSSLASTASRVVQRIAKQRAVRESVKA
uniref:FYVE-type domain-containing protein n=1 Tax=Peronospora matthiolae TaxID=2874970 RepID=A0AAV1TIP3_9STRA